MADLGSLARFAPTDIPAPRLLAATVTRAPESPGAPFYAVVATFDPTREFEVENWRGDPPERDERVLLGIDQDDQAWLIGRAPTGGV